MAVEYEVTYLADPTLPDEARGELDASVDTLINELGGTITHSAPSIRRRLMYPINKQTAAFARALNIQLEGEKLEEFRKTLRRKAGVMRLAIIRTPQRTEVSPDMLFQPEPETAGRGRTPATEPRKPAKPVS